ncbi:unnamed protein product [Rotaria sordida]|uniref:Uncharacterized protein n=1 Tax=Rotaria sordida TaxID=392033 RepID=A0A819QQE9_9BILA|nr:unnamed protein product [Rotaria sordida]CAF1176256.1 unnamed protein product [Rotaria sordida]CAF1353539.1 unnamed protein product [Rotaria sordida]CAF3831665.1 unnamed protein product [Rotaria sordida]CAF3964180.1 unnamed protein product [Rotaria sordida]
MSTVPYYTDQALANLPASFDIARRDDFFGFSNPMQAIESIAPTPRNPDGTIQRPTQIVTVSGGAIPPDLVLESAGGSFFDMRPPSEIFADMDARLNRQRQNVLNSPQMLQMLQQPPRPPLPPRY